jgi:ABC-type glycerol-3-phosphate transport system substrate-binding protein
MTKMTDLSRRRMMQAAGALGAGALAGSAFPAWRARAAEEMTMWWWGEQELPGLQGYVDELVKRYTAASVKPMLQDTAVVISQFQTAAAAGNAPDIQFLWNGIYHMESVWLGYLQALDGLVNADTIKASQPTLLSNYDGHTYRLGWYPLPMIWIYNKDMFEKAGLDPEKAPETWDSFLAACEKLKSAGMSPVGGGIQDGYWGEWFFGHGLAQCVDSPGQAVELFTGERSFEDPAYHAPWVKLEELKKAGFLNPEMSSTELYPGIDLIVAGKVAMGESIGSRMPADSKATNGKIGAMVMPVFGKSKLAGKPIFDAQGIGISKNAKDPKAAAAFLEFMQAPEQLKLLHEKTGWLPSNSNFDTSVITDASVVAMWKRWGQGENIPYVANVVPGQWYEQALLPAGQQVVAGKITGAEAGALAAKVAKEWRDFNPDMVDHYKKWAKDLG